MNRLPQCRPPSEVVGRRVIAEVRPRRGSSRSESHPCTTPLQQITDASNCRRIHDRSTTRSVKHTPARRQLAGAFRNPRGSTWSCVHFCSGSADVVLEDSHQVAQTSLDDSPHQPSASPTGLRAGTHRCGTRTLACATTD
jgi:hypothetical protein